ncbi:MAG: citrate lyase subunit alpha [Synergistaceae bacterium]|jgi:citrate lyase subunit alpha/citrate CoA-transferase|nr:citrate lyase subunit alpha [Synergistaceae bacterium]
MSVSDHIDGYGAVVPYRGVNTRVPGAGGVPAFGAPRPLKTPGQCKLLRSLEDAITASGLKSGMTVSFHHHLRNGDKVVNSVLDACARMGIEGLTLFPTALFDVHEPVAEHVRRGVVRQIMGSVNGAVGRMVSTEARELAPVVLRSHGGRPRAIAAGEVHIDVAFIAAPAADGAGNLSGRFGPSACGSLGYPQVDAMYADRVVAVTDNLMPVMPAPVSIPQIYTDFVVEVPSIGDPAGIVSGTTAVTRNPLRLLISRYAARVIELAPCFANGLSFQTGAGGITLAVTAFLREAMAAKGIKGGFGLGGITGYFVEMLRDGLLERLLDVQSFDAAAVKSLGGGSGEQNSAHVEISADWYANPWNAGAAVNGLDAVVLGATEIDRDFNVNVNTEADGTLLHGIGGHQDTAAGAGITIIAQPLLRGRAPCVVERVDCVTTPGDVVDVLVTEYGVTVNPNAPPPGSKKIWRGEILERVRAAGLPVVPMDALIDKAKAMSGPMSPIERTDRVAAVVEWRDGSVLDVVYAKSSKR